MKIIHLDDPNFFGTALLTNGDGDYSASITSWSSTKITFTNSDTGAKTYLTGTGFSVDGSGNITGGSITKFVFKNGGVKNSVWSDLAWSGTDWQAVLDEFQAVGDALFFDIISADPILYDASNYTSSDGSGVLFSFAMFDQPVTFIGSDYIDYIEGSKAADTLTGGKGVDAFIGKGGSDTIKGNNGNDILDGGKGGDHLEGGAGGDLMRGGLGNDKMYGGSGNDQMIGDKGGPNAADGNDKMYGGAGADQMHGDGGNDRLEGGTGADQMAGGDGRDILIGGDQNDEIDGGAGKDILKGGKGHDKLNGGKGNDTLTGAAGADKFIFTGTAIGADTITDFTDDVDILKLDDALWGGGISKADLLATYASVVSGDVVFDFGSGQMITLTGITDTADLLNDLVIF